MNKAQLKDLIKEVIAEASTRKVFVVVGLEDEGVVSAVFSSEEKAMNYMNYYVATNIPDKEKYLAKYIQVVDLDPSI